MKSLVVSIFALMVLAGSALAATPSTFSYVLATQPMIAGSVASVNDHSLVMRTEQGEEVTLAMDSKTMVPTDLKAGMPAWVEFKAMPDGHKYARRVIPMRGENPGRELAYANPTGTQETRTAANETESGASGAAGAAGAGAMGASGTGAGESGDAHGHGSAAGPSHEGGTSESLPQTAGNQTLVLALGLIALAAAGALALGRRSRRA